MTPMVSQLSFTTNYNDLNLFKIKSTIYIVKQTVVQYYFLQRVMPKMKIFSDQNHNIQTEQMQKEPIIRVVDDIQYPSHLAQVNYLSMQSFESGVEDQITHKSYFEAIVHNQNLFAGKTVLHLTDGINILYSIFAVNAGCQRVYCVINGDSQRELQNIFMMNQIIKENHYEDRITVLPWNKFNSQIDIIIAEPMGYCLHFDGLLDRMIEARQRFLTSNGMMFPNSITFKCAMIHDEYFYDQKIEYWNDIYGIPMKSMKKWISHEPIIRVVDPSLIVSRVTKILTFNLQTISFNEIMNIDRILEMEVLGNCKANGIVIWFQAFFDYGIEKKDIKASPWGQSTKFTQTTLYWPTVQFYTGGKLRVRIKGHKYPKQGYSVVDTQVDDKIYQYSFS